jgi:hypothetical protein
MQRIRTSARGSVDIGSREDIEQTNTARYDVIITLDIEPIDAVPIRAYHWFNMTDGYAVDLEPSSAPLTDTIAVRTSAEGHALASDAQGHYTRQMFEQAADVAANALRDGYHVAIHCYVGRSRSVAVAIAAIGRVLNLSYAQARDIVREQRPQADMKPLLARHAEQYIDR